MDTPEGRRAELREGEEIAKELEEVAELVLHHPELNHKAAERLLAIARDIRADATRAARYRGESSSNER